MLNTFHVFAFYIQYVLITDDFGNRYRKESMSADGHLAYFFTKTLYSF